MIDIMMLSCNRSQITQLSITEIVARTTTPYRLVVVDNGSTEGSAEMLKEMYKNGTIQELVLLDENWGVHFGHNTSLDLVKSEPYYVCTDSDLVPCVPNEDGDWLSRLIDLAQRHPQYGAIACRLQALPGEPGDRFKDAPEIREMSHVGAHLRLMRTTLVRKVGGWRKIKTPSRNNEDWHIGQLIRKAEFKVGYSRDIRCLHLWGPGPEVKDRTEDEWGYPLGSEHGHHPIWPPVSCFAWDRLGFDWKTCLPANEVVL